jgi:hypothetical protein
MSASDMATARQAGGLSSDSAERGDGPLTGFKQVSLTAACHIKFSYQKGVMMEDAAS